MNVYNDMPMVIILVIVVLVNIVQIQLVVLRVHVNLYFSIITLILAIVCYICRKFLLINEYFFD
jgi:hypothetical protein